MDIACCNHKGARIFLFHVTDKKYSKVGRPGWTISINVAAPKTGRKQEPGAAAVGGRGPHGQGRQEGGGPGWDSLHPQSQGLGGLQRNLVLLDTDQDSSAAGRGLGIGEDGLGMDSPKHFMVQLGDKHEMSEVSLESLI